MSRPVNFIEDVVDNFYSMLVFFATLLQSPFLLLLRLIWGIQFVQTGWGKLMHVDQVTQFFISLHIPFPTFNVYMAACTEFFGGMLLTIGLASRLTAIPLIVTMVVAYATSEQDALKALLSFNFDPFVAAAPFPFLIVSAIVLCFGPGMFSVDHLIRRWRGDL